MNCIAFRRNLLAKGRCGYWTYTEAFIYDSLYEVRRRTE
jgi:hypothetical protein